MKGSTGGAVSLTYVGAPALAAAFSSVPVMPPRTPAVGLSVWTSKDENLTSWAALESGSCAGTSGPTTGMICPALVPESLNAGYIGDSFAWTEDSLQQRTVYVLTGSNVCPNASAPWCGYGAAGATPQALLFSSTNLVNWTFVSQFWAGAAPGRLPKNRVDTPVTYALKDGRQAFVWLANQTTYWMVGTLNRTTMRFSAAIEGREDGGAFFCSQSLSDPLGRRVQFGWLKLEGGGIEGYSGAQSLPREVIVDPTAAKGTGGLWFRPHAAIWTLHSGAAFSALVDAGVTSTPLSLTAALVGALARPVQMHLRFIVTIDVAPGATGGALLIDLLGGTALGGATLTLERSSAPTPMPRNCTAGAIVDGADTRGAGLSVVPFASTDVGMAGALKCRALCCANPQCGGFTFSDPQPGTAGKVHDCWLKGGDAAVVPGATCNGTKGTTAGHCYSGVVPATPPRAKVLALRVVGNGVDISVPLAARVTEVLAGVTARGASAGADAALTAAALLDVFIDGAIVEVFANDGEGVVSLSLTGATVAEYAVVATSAGAAGGAVAVATAAPRVSLTAWGMERSVE